MFWTRKINWHESPVFWKVQTECQGGKWGCIGDEELSPRTGKEEKSGTESSS